MFYMAEKKFSNELETWLKASGKKTLGSLEQVFGKRSFAIIVIILMAIPALPIPTGGITHIFELIVMLIALEMIIWRQTIWLPRKILKKELGPAIAGKFVPYLLRRIRWFEKYSRPRFYKLLNDPNFGRLAGLLFLVLALGAFLAPPFSVLDTLPALGAVMLALSLIFGDVILFILGIVLGSFGFGVWQR